MTSPSAPPGDGILVGRTSAGLMFWVFDPAISHPDQSRVYAFALHAGEMREYTLAQVATLFPMQGEAANAAIAEYLRWKEARGKTFLRDEERRREQKTIDAKRAAIEEAKRRAERVQQLVEHMTRKQTNDALSIARFVEEHRIPYLVHFTRVENLVTIAENGILPRTLLEQEFRHNDSMRLDGFPEASSLSLSFPNYLMFYRYRCLYPDANWAVLLLTVDILSDLPCLFFTTNAANSKFRDAGDDALESRMGLDALSAMFYDDPPGVRGERGLPSRATTDPQAEVLTFSVVAPERIGAVCLLRPDRAVEAMLRGRLPHAKVSVGGKLFEPRADYRFWQSGARVPYADTTQPQPDIPF